MSTITIKGGRPVGTTAEEAQAVRAAMAAADAEAAENWHDDGWRKEMAAELTTTIFEGFAHENLLSRMAEVETAEKGDRIFVEEVKGLEVFWVAVGGAIDQSRITERVWELPRDRVGFHVEELEEKMESGFSRASAQLVSLAVQQMDAAFNARLLSLYQAAIPDNTSPYYIEGAGLSLSALNTALTEVQDTSNSDQISIIGRATMVNQIADEIQDSGWFVPETNETIRRTGVVGQYRGANVLMLRNYKDPNDVPRIPANNLWVVGADAAKVGIWGGMRAQEWTPQGGFYWNYQGWRDAGFALRKPEHVRRIVDTEIPAGQ